MGKIQRYNAQRPSSMFPTGYMSFDDDGWWCQWRDASERIADLERELAEATDLIRDMMKEWR